MLEVGRVPSCLGRHPPRAGERAQGARAARRRPFPARALGHVQPGDACLGPARGGFAGAGAESGRATRDAAPRRTGRAGARGRRRAVVACRRRDRARIPEPDTPAAITLPKAMPWPLD